MKYPETPGSVRVWEGNSWERLRWERPWCSQSAIPSPGTTGSTRAWAWFPFRPGAGVQGRGHQGLRKQPSVKTPLQPPSAHSDEGTRKTVRGYLDSIDSRVWEIQRRVPLKDQATRQGSVWEEKDGLLHDFMHSGLVLCLP